MSIDKNLGLLVGRFQPLHLGHEKLIQSKKQEYNHLIVFIGSINKQRTRDNPLNFKERKKILSKIFPGIDILGVEDKGDAKLWVSAIEDKVNNLNLKQEKFIPISGNVWTIECFQESGYDNIDTVDKQKLGTSHISGAKIRKKIRDEKKWRKFVSTQVLDKLEQYYFEELVKKYQHE